MTISQIRNFCIIAHIDHGKSTLADRILEYTGTISKRDLRAQFLDDNEIERERGITIKAKAVAIKHDGYLLNLIDTPGHVDFSYEVSRSLSACEGAILLVDATQGVQAQTVANALMAIDLGLTIIPVLNKIDMQSARPDEVAEEMENSLDIAGEDILRVSAKQGVGVPELIAEVIKRIPPPSGSPDKTFKALIFDSVYDDYRGVIVYIRVIDGTIAKGSAIRFLGGGTTYTIDEVGIFVPTIKGVPSLSAGEVGYFIANIKSLRDVVVGDTVALKDSVDVIPLQAYKEPIPMVFCGFYPTNDFDFNGLKRAMEILSLNDSSLKFQPESSDALGLGFRCGFLGLLHMEIVKERLKRECNMDVVQTPPTVTYEVSAEAEGKRETIKIDNPAKLPPEQNIVEWREPVTRVSLVAPSDQIGTVMKLCESRRGEYVGTEYISQTRAIVTYDIPFAEIVFDFYDKLKSVTHGYGTMDYTITGYQTSDLVKLVILVAGQEVDALSIIVPREQAENKGRAIIKVLRKEIPRHLFQISLQASIGKRVVAREDIKAVAKNVTAKCYGGDITRKRKLLDKQKEGKKKMKNIGSVEIPQKAFMAVLSAGVE